MYALIANTVANTTARQDAPTDTLQNALSFTFQIHKERHSKVSQSGSKAHERLY